jgi:integrase
MATIETRTGREGKTTYRAKIRVKGFPVESATFERKTDAREWAQRIEADMKAGRHFGGAKLHTFHELANEYEKAARDLRTFAARERHLNFWRAEFGRAPLCDVTSDRIKRVREKLLAGGTQRFVEPATGVPEKDAKRQRGNRSGPTVNRYLATLSACMTYGVKELEWLEKNPVTRVKKSKENPGRVRFLSDDELPRLLDASRSDTDLYLALVLSLITGGRQSEIMGLRWPQIDFARRVITLNQGTTKNSDARALPLSGEAFELLQERAKVRSLRDDRVFPPIGKAGARDLRYAWERALKAAGITNFRWHDLRHTAASYLAMSGVSLVEIAKILGHRTLAMVARYAHLDPSHVVAVGDRLADRMRLGGKNAS